MRFSTIEEGIKRLNIKSKGVGINLHKYCKSPFG